MRRCDTIFKRLPLRTYLWAVAAMGAAGVLCGAAGEDARAVSNLLIALALMLVGGRIAGELFERINSPSVMGELLFGVVLGNLTLVGITRLEFIYSDPFVAALADLGVILLLFYVGVESHVREMLSVGVSALLVAVVGVLAPSLFGWGASVWLQPEADALSHIYVGAILCATSVGITARVLSDLRALRLPEARIILGAAVIDDILGLMVLAVVAGMVRAAAAGGEADIAATAGWVTLKAALFVVGAVAVGRLAMPRAFRTMARLKPAGSRLTVALALCFVLSWLAHEVGLAFIVGAFLAGLVIEEREVYPGHPDTGANEEIEARRHAPLGLTERLHPIVAFLSPLFFVRTGAGMDLSVLGSASGVVLALVFTLAAILGKQACGLGVLQRGVDRLSVGIGMVPRGEVGLIFASLGASLFLPNGERVVDHTAYGATLVMVFVTTMVTPPLLRWSLFRWARRRVTSER